MLGERRKDRSHENITTLASLTIQREKKCQKGPISLVQELVYFVWQQNSNLSFFSNIFVLSEYENHTLVERISTVFVKSFSLNKQKNSSLVSQVWQIVTHKLLPVH